MDTIVAEATPKGRGGVGIIRLSGPRSYEMATKITGSALKARYATLVSFRDGAQCLIDEGIALFFKGPHSFTGEDVVELQCHGGPVIMDRLIETALRYGARLARPGEFTERAFLNDKIDLIQAEAISDLIAAQTLGSAQAALRALQGEFSRHIDVLVKQLIHLRVFIEATLDFPEEDVEFVQEAKVIEALRDIMAAFHTLLSSAKRGVLLQEGIHIALIGKPNAGKSSLMNRLTQRDTAIVSEIPGTTRDLIREKIDLQGVPIHLVDTAGLRETEDLIEQEGVRRTQKALNEADIVLLVVDARREQDVQDILQDYAKALQGRTVITLLNKIDLLGEVPIRLQNDTLTLSVKTGAGLSLLEEMLIEKLGIQIQSEGQFIARRRHLDALARAEHALQTGLDYYCKAERLELLAEECRIAQLALSEITGAFRADDLLGAIFSTFCIGK